MSKINNELVPECFAETELVKIILDLKAVNHQHGKSNVAHALKSKLINHQAIGIVDEDKNKKQPQYFSEFTIEHLSENNVLVKKHQTLNQYLIIIQPEMERWLLNAAFITELNPQEFNLPGDVSIRSITKSNQLYSNNDFKNFIKKLIALKSPPIITLRDFILSIYPKEI